MEYQILLQQEQYNIRRIQNKVNNTNSLELYKSFMEKKRKKERIDWVLHRGLRREAKITRNHRKPYSEQKMSYIIEIMFSKAGLVMKEISKFINTIYHIIKIKKIYNGQSKGDQNSNMRMLGGAGRLGRPRPYTYWG